MDIAMFRKHHYLLLGAATSMVAASTFRRLSASCGLVLLSQILSHTTWFTVVVMSAQPTTVPVSTASQSAVSPNGIIL